MQPPASGIPAHDNRQLFSNHFLNERLRSGPEWSDNAEQAERIRQELRDLFSAQRPTLCPIDELTGKTHDCGVLGAGRSG
ncbi:MAG TPA: hypothetical protein VFI91_06320 [Longimicrobiaceae bacterium]|nr:hypothetical protein [Longimicrobiaceae bacterium]